MKLHIWTLYVAIAISFASSNETWTSTTSTFFIEELVKQYGSNGTLSVSELRNLVANLNKGTNTGHESFIDESGSHGQDAPTQGQGNFSTQKVSLGDSVCANGNWSYNQSCWTNKCLSADDILVIHSIPVDARLNGSQLHQISPSLLYTSQNKECMTQDDKKLHQPHPAQVWGYGLLFVTVINLCSLGGLAFLPLMSKKFYRKLLMFMVALAVGTLCGSALLFLIPACFEMTADNSPHLHTFIWKCMTIIGGIYLFFLVERLLKIILEWRQKKEDAKYDKYECHPQFGSGDDCYNVHSKHEEKLENMPTFGSVKTHEVHREEGMNMSFEVARSVTRQEPTNHGIERDNSSAQLLSNSSANELVTLDSNAANYKNGQANGSCRPNGEPGLTTVPEVTVKGTDDVKDDDDAQSVIGSHLEIPPRKRIKTVAWMVIFGDGLHNFIDGLSIGAAFAQSILSGISISIAVVCEELPHELGDFAILLNSGMSMKQALSCNFLSACMCYLGFVVGALIGDSTDHALWIFAVAGGMFLYISLVDMLPEVNQAAEEETKKTGCPWRVFFLQNAGLLSGFGIMLLLAKYGETIDFS